MTTIPNNWVEEDRHEIVESIVDGIMKTISNEDAMRMVWDMLYDDLLTQGWTDLFMHAELYAPELLEPFDAPKKEESSF
jgi:hypothetical protein